MDAALPDLFLFDDWRIDCVQNLAWCGKRRVNVEPKAMMVLQYLAARPGKVVTREELFRQFWPNQVVTQDALNRVMSTLRRAFNDNACHPKYIATVRKVGYKVVAPVITLENPRTKALLEFQAGQELLSGQLDCDRDVLPGKVIQNDKVNSFPTRYLYLVLSLVLSLVLFLGLYTQVNFSAWASAYPSADISSRTARTEAAGHFRGAHMQPYIDKMPGQVGKLTFSASAQTFLIPHPEPESLQLFLWPLALKHRQALSLPLPVGRDDNPASLSVRHGV